MRKHSAIWLVVAGVVGWAITSASVVESAYAQTPTPDDRSATPSAPPPDPLTTHIAVRFVDVPIQQALSIISERAQVRLTYSPDDLPPARRVSLSDTNVTVGAALDVVLASTALHAVVMSDGGVVLTTAVAQASGPRSTNTESDTSGTVSGVLVGRGDGQPVPYGTVMLVETGEARFADADGHFRIARVAPGTHTLRARQIGYAPTDTTVQVDTEPSVTTVTIRLARLPSLLGLVKVEGQRSGGGCVATGVPDSTVNPGLASVFAQVEENVARYRLLWDQYPFRYTREEQTGLLLEPGGYEPQHDETEKYESRSQRKYRVGAVVYEEPDESGQPRRVMYLPTFRDLADSAFLAAHCFSSGGQQRLDGKSSALMLRVDFEPARSISSPDVEGSLFLDANRLIVKRAVFRLTKPELLAPPVVGVTVTSSYRELMPLVPVLDEARTVQPLPQSGLVTRTIVTDDRLTDYRFEDRKPGDQSTTVPATASAAAASRALDQMASVAGRVIRADGTPVQGAAVGAITRSDSAATSDSGRFVLRDITPGPHMLWVHAVGFKPTRVAVTLTAGPPRSVTITVAPTAPTLPTIVTTASYQSAYAAVGLDKRMIAGLGQFLTFDQIQARHAAKLSELLKGLRGIQVRQHDREFEAMVQSTRPDGLNYVGCVSFVLDGVPQTQLEAHTATGSARATGDADLLIDPNGIGAIEVYNSSERPAGFEAGAQWCELVVIWSRARLGLTSNDSAVAPTGAPESPVPTTIGTAVFPAGTAPACQPPPAIDTARLNVYAVLESAITPGASDTAWLQYSDRVLAAFLGVFALPSQVELPVFGYPYPAPVTRDSQSTGLVAAPQLSSVVAFTLGPTGTLLNSRIAASSLSGDADTSALAAVQAAASTQAFPTAPATAAGQPTRFDLLVTTTTPDPSQHAVVVGQIDVPVWPLARSAERQPVESDAPGPMGSVAPPVSAVFELVVDEHGRPIMSTVRAITQPGDQTADPRYREVVARTARELAKSRFDPALVGACPVRQVIMTPFTD